MTHPYTVALVDAQPLPSSARIAAEARFATALERALGDAEQVASAYRAWRAGHEGAAEEMDKESIQLGLRWHRAADQARQAGFRDLGEMPGAHFEVRVARR